MMKRLIIRYMAAAAAVAFSAVCARGQNLTESVTVEGRYTPEIIPADRLSLPPTAITVKAPESPMRYDRKGVAAAFAPDALSMAATAWRADKTYDTSKGYLDLRLGSWLNSSLSAGVAVIDSEETRLNAWLQHNSTCLWQPWKENPETGQLGADRRYRYDEAIGADLSQRLWGAGELKASLRYHLGLFNYYGSDQGPEKDGRIKAPTQTLNDFSAKAGWIGESHGRFSYKADADVRHFAYRAMYLPLASAERAGEFSRTKGERETTLNVGGEVGYGLSDDSGNGSVVGLALRYTGVMNAIGEDVNRLEATPAYTLTGRSYSLRLGASLAVVGNGLSTRFRAAPDVRFSMRRGIAAISASIGGGTRLRTLAWRHTMDYYANPGMGCYEAAYSPIDARLAVQLNPGGRWTFGMEGSWTTTLDECFGGLYQALLNENTAAYGRYPESGRIHGYSVAVNAGYAFCRYLSLKGRASWQPQDGSRGVLNGFDRPEFTADLRAESNPTDRLSLALDYRLRARRQLLAGNASRLAVSADYRVSDRISVGVELDNLLNRHEEFLPGLPTEGFTALGGVQIVF